MLETKTGATFASKLETTVEDSEKIYIIPPHRTRYLSEIAETNRAYDKRVREQANIAEVAGAFAKLEEHYRAEQKDGGSMVEE